MSLYIHLTGERATSDGVLNEQGKRRIIGPVKNHIVVNGLPYLYTDDLYCLNYVDGSLYYDGKWYSNVCVESEDILRIHDSEPFDPVKFELPEEFYANQKSK